MSVVANTVESINQSINFYSANIPGEARLSGVDSQIGVQQQNLMKQLCNINGTLVILVSMG